MQEGIEKQVLFGETAKIRNQGVQQSWGEGSTCRYSQNLLHTGGSCLPVGCFFGAC